MLGIKPSLLSHLISIALKPGNIFSKAYLIKISSEELLGCIN
jgi:hypothetical protein